MLKNIVIICIIIILVILAVFGIYYYVTKEKEAEKVYEETKIPVLLYHDIIEKIPENDPYNFEYITTAESFEENIQKLLQKGYTIITINELYNLDKENREIPKKPIIINFDDGLISNYELVFPILKKYNVKVRNVNHHRFSGNIRQRRG